MARKSVPASNRMSPQLEVRRLLWLDPRKLDHLSPLCDLVIDEFAELSRRDRHRLSAHEGKARRHTGIGEDGVDLFVELFDVAGYSWGHRSRPKRRLHSRAQTRQ